MHIKSSQILFTWKLQNCVLGRYNFITSWLTFGRNNTKMDLLSVSEDEKNQILKIYNTNHAEIEQTVEIIRAWKSKQPHLPQDITDEFIKKFLLRNKFCVEKTKEKIENYYTLRGRNADLLRGFEDIMPSHLALIYLPMPKITSTLERVIIMKIVKFDPKVYNIEDTFKNGLAITELALKYDDSIGLRYILDYNGFTLKHLATWNPNNLIKYISLAEKAYSNRVCGLEMINLPKFINKLLGILKLIFPTKIYEKVRSHEDLESLYEIIPKECLPEEYGGCGGSIKQLIEQWDKAIKDHQEFLKKSLKNVANENLRLLDMKDTKVFGEGGTFKKLEFD